MSVVLVTGMSGTGKSSVLEVLAARGHEVLDTDTDDLSVWVLDERGERDWVWRLEPLRRILVQPRDGHLFVAGCRTNQGALYGEFDAVAVLRAPADVLLERVRSRANPFGSRAEDREKLLGDLAEAEPRLVATATVVLDASRPLDAVADDLEVLAASTGAGSGPTSG